MTLSASAAVARASDQVIGSSIAPMRSLYGLILDFHLTAKEFVLAFKPSDVVVRDLSRLEGLIDISCRGSLWLNSEATGVATSRGGSQELICSQFSANSRSDYEIP